MAQSPAKSTMSDGNSNRDWKVYEHIYFELIKYYKGVFAKQQGYKEIAEIEGKTIKLIDHGLSLFLTCVFLNNLTSPNYCK